MDDNVKVLLGLLGTVLAAVLLYRGTKFTASSARSGVEQASKVDAQESALAAWQELLEPYRAEVKAVRQELEDVKQKRAVDKKAHDDQVARLTERVDLLQLQLTEWKRVARVLARWGSTLRDQVLSLGGTVPATPEELLTLRAMEDES